MNKLSLQKLNLSTIKNSSILIIGRRASGKTFLTKKIINQNKTLDSKYVIFEYNFSRGCEYPSEYTDITHSRFICNNFDSNRLIYLSDDTNEFDTKQNFFVCDNNIFEMEKILRDNSVKNIMNSNTCIFTQQYPFKINLENLDYIFIFNDPSNVTKRKIYELYIKDTLMTFSIFDDILSSLNKYECLVIDKNDKTKLYDQTNPIDMMVLR